jgi:peroxiredoxin
MDNPDSGYQQSIFNTFVNITVSKLYLSLFLSLCMKNKIVQQTRLFAILILLLILCGFSVHEKNNPPLMADEGYRIRVQIAGIKDTVCYLANYYGDKTYLTDTAAVDAKGRFVFQGDSVLPGGVYIIAGQSNNKYLEFIVDWSQDFSITTDISTISTDVRFEKSPENVLFFDFIQYNMKIRKEIESLKKEQQNYKDNPDSVKAVKERIDHLNNNLNIYQENIITDNPESFVSVMLRAMKEPEVKNVPVLSNGREDSLYRFQYYKSHFWDNFDLTDDRLLRTPLFHKRMERYFKDIVYQQPDSIILAVDDFVNKTRGNKKVFKYTVWYLTYKFETSKIMGFDEIFVHLVDTYYAKGEAFWADSSTIKAMTKNANALRPILIGEKAPELILVDTSGKFVSLHHTIAKYLIVFFYESDCGHCKKEISELKVWMDKQVASVQVFAVCTDTSLVKWKKFISTNHLNWINVNATRSITRDYHTLYDISMTPTLFLLDEKKKIIAKRLKVAQMIPFLENYDRKVGNR